VIVRTDLPIGVIAAQIAHAAGESSPGNLTEGTFAIVLGVENEAALQAVRARLSVAGIDHVPIHEPDAPYGGKLMAIGCAPVMRSRLRRALSSVPLFRGSTCRGSSTRAPAREATGSTPSPGTTRAQSSMAERSE
jgi:hypothetical protein